MAPPLINRPSLRDNHQNSFYLQNGYPGQFFQPQFPFQPQLPPQHSLPSMNPQMNSMNGGFYPLGNAQPMLPMIPMVGMYGMGSMGMPQIQQQRTTVEGYGISSTAPTNAFMESENQRRSTFNWHPRMQTQSLKRPRDGMESYNKNPSKHPRIERTAPKPTAPIPTSKLPPPKIEGTSITLNTTEDIEKWREERRKRFPTAKRIAEKEAEKAAKVPPTKDQQGRLRGRGRERGRGQRGGRGGKFNRVRQPTTEISSAPQTEASAAALTTVTAQADGLVDYGSDDANSSLSSSSDSSDSSDTSSSEAETDAIHSSMNVEEISAGANSMTDGKEGNSRQPKKLCRFFSAHGHCKMGKKCKYLHQKSQKKQQLKPKVVRPSLFSQLMEREISDDIKDAIAVIDFLAANSWLENVELKPGQLEAQRKLIQVIDEKTMEVDQEKDQGKNPTESMAEQCRKL